MENSLYDVVVVGGGLAGLSLSIQCANAGYRVALFEKEIYPFHKVCGEYISNESRFFLKTLGVDVDDLQLPNIRELVLTDTRGKTFNFPLDLGGFGISRYLLDNMLYQIGLQRGVDVFTGTKVEAITYNNMLFTITTNKNVVIAKVAAGSFGKRSNIDLKWKRSFAVNKPNALNNYIGVKYHVEISHPTNEIALHNFTNGYCGLSAIEEGKNCLCYLTTATNLRNSGNSIRQMEEQVLFKNPALKQVFSSAKFLYKQPLVISQVSFQKKSQVQDHVLMLGDAAGLITPLCGNGMSMALHSSKLAFDQINNFLRNIINRQDLEENYSREWKHHFSRRLQTGRIVQRMFVNKYSTSLFLNFMHTFKPLAKEIIKLTHGSSF